MLIFLMKSLSYLSLPGKVLSLEEKKKLSLFQNYLLFFLFFQICSIQLFIEHKIYTTVRLSTESKTVIPPHPTPRPLSPSPSLALNII